MAVYSNQNLYDTLKELQVIPIADLDAAFQESITMQTPLGQILTARNLITESDLIRVVADLAHVPFVELSRTTIPPDILSLIPEVIAKKQKIIAFRKDAQGLHIAMSDPNNIEIIDFLQKKIGLPLIVYLANDTDIARAFSLYLKDVNKAFGELISENINTANSLRANQSDPPIIKIVETIISYAYENNASDVHIEPEEKYALVRFRIDGILHDIIKLPLSIFNQVIMRVKVLSRLRTDEHQAPQDGKIEFYINSQILDVRVSTVPVKRGEKIVMRLLSEHARQITLLNLGLVGKDLEKVKSAYQKPYGMILATGPTGSGKTTTMYAILKLLNSRDVNIMTIEDPIEYDLEGINQIQVNSKTNLTFANGLRSILRQDPNIILVGEIRDQETADIAINAALTGHLVLSTLHTNDAPTAIPRLFDMGIEPFLVASTVNVIIAQRLVRKIHNVCRASIDIPRTTLAGFIDEAQIYKVFGPGDPVRVYKGKGCKICHNTGYEDRMGIFEVLVIDDEIRLDIVAKKDSSILHQVAIKNGMQTMLEDGLSKVKQGLTTIEEIMRVTKE